MGNAGIALTAAATTVWAKHNRQNDSWLPLYRHMTDSSAVAGRLWDEWVPAATRRQIGSHLPGGEEDARRVLVWLAALHDLGKASPVFATQVPDLADAMHDAGLKMPRSLTKHDRKEAPHSFVGHVLLRRWLVTRYGWQSGIANTYAIVPGGHHGVAPTARELSAIEERPVVTGSGLWTTIQDELAAYCTELAGIEPRLASLSAAPLTPQAQVLLTAIVIVSDWIASNEELFPYDIEYDLTTEERTTRGLAKLNLPPPWIATTPPDIDSLFASRFDLPPGASVRPVQRSVHDLARELPTPGLMIVEAPMGEGKTEAALAAAEVFAHRTGAGGCFIALPTMATSDAMFGRVLDWVERLPDLDGDRADVSVYLAHSKQQFNARFSDLMHGTVSGIGLDEESDDKGLRTHIALAHQWLFGRKRGVLADFVIGTIDQILFGALKARHLALRHLALANKVVVIDEAHSYDTYMNVYLDRALEWLGAYQVPTIILSATLPARRRRELVEAYDRSRIPASPIARSRRRIPSPVINPSVFDVLDGDIGYPVVTASTGSTPTIIAVEPSGRKSQVQIELIADDDDSLLSRLRTDTVDGGCVAIIRNTVDRAQKTSALLEQYFPGEVTLIHSRFLSVDRLRIEEALRTNFGPHYAKIDSRRPRRHFVVGTQVLEQSLDVDFDLMITDLAPLDLVLQRIGRLHRHDRPSKSRPPRLREPRCLLSGVEQWSADPIEPIKPSRHVYGDQMLLRSAAVLREHLAISSSLALPDDIAPLVQRVYGDGFPPPAGWETAWSKADREAVELHNSKTERAGVFLLDPLPRRGATPTVLGWIARGAGDADDTVRGRAQVRDTEDGIEVLVIQRINDELRTLPWLDEHAGQTLSSGTEIPEPLARAVATCSVRLPPRITASWLINWVIDELEGTGTASWQDSRWLRGELILVMDESYQATLAGLTLEYDQHRGLFLHDEPEGGIL